MAYLLDANIFIQGKKLHYGFDFCPAFWDWLDASNANRTVFSIEKVRGELLDGNDDLSTWAQARDNAFFVPPDASTPASLAAVSTWANSGNYDPIAIRTFLRTGADYYLVAQAHALGHVVVSHEIRFLRTRPSESRFPTRASGLVSRSCLRTRCFGRRGLASCSDREGRE